MPAARAFLSYRRDDTSGYAGRIYDRLQQRFPGQIFMDVSGIDAGVDFVESIEREVRACSVLIALIGRHWLDGHRLDEPDDVVNREIALALQSGVPVVPVLLRGAQMPSAGDLPQDLKTLARKNAVEIGEAAFDRDMEALFRALEPKLVRKKSWPRWGFIWKLTLTFAAFAAVIVSVVPGVYKRGAPKQPKSPVARVDSSPPPSSGNPEIDALAKAVKSIPLGVPANRGDPSTASFAFDPAGKWSVQASGPVSGAMSLNLKPDRNYEISEASGALAQLATLLGSAGTWTFDTRVKRLALIPSGSGVGLGMRITAKKEDSFSAASFDNDGVIYTFTRR